PRPTGGRSRVRRAAHRRESPDVPAFDLESGDRRVLGRHAGRPEHFPCSLQAANDVLGAGTLHSLSPSSVLLTFGVAAERRLRVGGGELIGVESLAAGGVSAGELFAIVGGLAAFGSGFLRVERRGGGWAGRRSPCPTRAAARTSAMRRRAIVR